MKHDLNLALKRPVNKKAAKNALLALLFLVILGGLAYVAVTIPQLIKTGELKIQTDLNTKLAALSQTEKKFKEGTNTQKQLLENINMLKELETNKKDVPDILQKIEGACPAGTLITRMVFNPDSIALDGSCSSDTELAAFISNLNTIEGFTNIIANKSEKNTEENRENFTITISYTVPLRAEPITVPTQTAAPSASPLASVSPSSQTSQQGGA